MLNDLEFDYFLYKYEWYRDFLKKVNIPSIAINLRYNIVSGKVADEVNKKIEVIKNKKDEWNEKPREIVNIANNMNKCHASNVSKLRESNDF